MKVRDLMVRDVKTCAPGDAANRAAQLMWENDLGFVVATSPAGRVEGTITDRDICMAAYITGLPLTRLCVADVVSGDVVSCGPDDELETASARMRAFRVRRLPVIDSEGKLAGVVTLNDLARAAVLRRESGLGVETVAVTLAEVCRPRRPPAADSTPPALPARAWSPPERRPQLTA